MVARKSEAPPCTWPDIPAWEAQLDARLRHCDETPPEVWIEYLDADSREQLLAECNLRLTRRPHPIGPHADHDPERRILERVAGWVEALRPRGECGRAIEAERTQWLRGGDAIRYLQTLRRFGRGHMASILARTVLQRASTPPQERERLEAFLEDREALPAGWDATVDALAVSPCARLAQSLLSFVPADRYLERLQLLVDLLLSRGVSGDDAFRIATIGPPTTAAVGLIEDGHASLEVVLERAAEAEGDDERGQWLGLASRAAAIQGQPFRALRLLRDAFRTSETPYGPAADLEWLYERADEEQRGTLERVFADYGELLGFDE